jgi:hypothetical protein
MILWSFSTTVRNPERLKPFLEVLSKLEGMPFDRETQKKYQIMLIQERLYRPRNLPGSFQDLFNNPEKTIKFEQAKEVFELQNYEDPPMRGRQSVNPLIKLGLAIAKESEGIIRITPIGKMFLDSQSDISIVFFKALLKLQFPNFISSSFSEKNGFNIKPFLATLHFINEANKLGESKGLTKNEFSLFIPSLINKYYFDENLKWLKKYRASAQKKEIIKQYAEWFYKSETVKKEKIKNFFEYGDNIMRYFRLTKYFKIETGNFGADWRILLEPLRQVEINSLLKEFSIEAETFKNKDNYYQFLFDINQPALPWLDDRNKLAQIIEQLTKEINKKKELLKTSSLSDGLILTEAPSVNEPIENFHRYINELRSILSELSQKIKKADLIDNFDKITEIIGILENEKLQKKLHPEILEKIITETLLFINDEIKIKPNYPTDDNGEPISHATGNQSDIECYYESFNAICEVTLDASNFQWIRESQPVMRHLKDFISSNTDKPAFCLFISPKTHIDTAYHFWTSCKHGYDGEKLKIIPLSSTQFAEIVSTYLNYIKSKQKRPSHKALKNFYEKVIGLTENCSGHSEWILEINQELKEFTKRLMYEN